MPEVLLENLCKNGCDNLPPSYKVHDLKRFSIDWQLYDYQVEALKQALVFIHKQQNKKAFEADYLHAINRSEVFWDQLSVNEGDENFKFLSNYYPVEDGEISFNHFMNRASFWMATGSGKTLVMIKLIELLFNLAKAGEIAEKNIMLLAPKDEILSQIKEHVRKFNTNGSLTIELRDLREFEYVSNVQQNLYQNNTVTVFYYRGDNIRDRNTEKLLNYEGVLNNSNWYVILDEAHKGDTSYSQQQQYYSLLSKNGMLFNFSATFTDDIDIVTTLYNFNLKHFLEAGYGKHIKVVDEEFSSFRNRAEDEPFTNDEKRHIVLKSLLAFTAVKKHAEEIRSLNERLYHNPLLVTTANQVNTDKADLKLFFEQLAAIGAGNFTLDDAKTELAASLRNNRKYQFITAEIPDSFIGTLQQIEKSDIFKYVFNADSPGQIEYTGISGNSREYAFRLKSATKDGHFGLVVASEIKKWSDNVLADFDKSNAVLTESFFHEINEPDNNINLLLGSRIFTEGWDSNRPNVINFINIGVNDEAKKFVLQTTGRGVRIEPIKNYRKRLKDIKKEKALSNVLSTEQQNGIFDNKTQTPVESLFVFATDKEVISNVIEGLNTSKSGDKWSNVAGIHKNEIEEDLLIPVFKEKSDYEPPAYKISERQYQKLLEYVGKEPNGQDKTLLMNVPDVATGQIITTLNKVRNKESIKYQDRQSGYSQPYQELLALNTHLNHKPEVIDHYKPVTNEIKHFERIQAKNIDEVTLNGLEETIYALLNKKYETREALYEAFRAGDIVTEQFELELELIGNSDFQAPTHSVNINTDFLKEHYYKPVLLAQQGFDKMFRHIVKHESEIGFLEELTNKAQAGLFDDFDCWYFSKIEENIDDINIPYFDSKEQEYRNFFPDFIFWLKKEDTLYITFVDPKGPEHQTNPTDKIIGFQDTIEKHDKMEVDGCEVIASLWMYNEDIRTKIDEKFRGYWTNDLDTIF